MWQHRHDQHLPVDGLASKMSPRPVQLVTVTITTMVAKLLCACGRLIVGLYSKQWFGLGIEDWNGGRSAAAIVEAVQDAFAILGDKHLTHRPQELAKIKLTDYFQAVLSAVSLLFLDIGLASQVSQIGMAPAV